MKFVFVSGGVVSGLGKGITCSSIGAILESFGIKVTIVKIDMYLNVDAGTIRPQEHGEVFVTEDGLETDQDLGNYERFLNHSLHRENYMTAGQVYKSVIDRERAFGYEGEDVEAIPHVTDEITSRIMAAGKINKADVVIIELGGTVGEYQNAIFFEASRILKLKKPKDVLQIHVTYLPFLKNIGELKSKPAQQSVKILNGMGIQPDFVITRSELPIDQKRKEKISVFCNVREDEIIGNPDLTSIYEVPLYLEEQKFGEKIIKKLGLKKKARNSGLSSWKKLKNQRLSAKKVLKIAMVGKYFMTGNYKLIDSYVSVVEAIKQASWAQGVDPEFTWIDSTEFEKGKMSLKGFDGIVVPQGWGSRGIEGKLMAVRYARENKIPYLGLCFGMQMATIEFARNVLKLKGANTTEADPRTGCPIIHVMNDQKEYLLKKQYGGTIRLGSWPCKIKEGSLLDKIYMKYGTDPSAPWYSDRGFNSVPSDTKDIIYERHRHRYEFNNDYREQFEKAGFVISGTSPDGKLVEAMELANHPFFLGTQFHPEYIARPHSPHPIFLAFVNACKK
ncbi:MAG: CTP synthase [Candidatus Woesebacteria bacterium]|nr:MAG: CTP synthase [Candidatus Woesebacteria bacterium]